jgi:hypothetical protein
MVGVRAAVIAVQSFVIVGIVLLDVVSLRLFWLKRDQYPIKARAPFRATLGLVLATSGMAIINALVAIFDYEFNCLLWGLFNYIFGINAGLVAIGCRVFDLCVNYESQQLKLVLMESEKNGSSLKFASGTISLETVLSYKNKFFKIGFIFFLLTNIPLLIAVSIYPQVWLPSNFYASDECNNFSVLMGVGCAFTAVLLAALIILLSKSLKNGQDNYFIKQELKQLSFVLFWGVIIWTLKKIIPGLSEASYATVGFMDILIVEFPAFWICYVSLFDIARKAMSFQGKFDLSKNSSVYDVAAAKDASSLEAPRVSVVIDNLEHILNNPELVRLFTEFLCKEFCVENLLFLLAVKKYKSEFNLSTRAENINAGLAVFHKFIKSNSPLEVNISGRVHDVLQEKFGKSQEKREINSQGDAASFVIEGSIVVSETVFDAAYREVAGMLTHDCLRRFKKQMLPSKTLPISAQLMTNVASIPVVQV